MTNIWNQTIHISKELATELINSQIDIEVKQIELIGEGFDNVAYLINNKIVFRFPRREISIELLKTETQLLPHIAKNVSFSLSCPQFFGQSTETYPYLFIGYPIIKGIILSDFIDLPIAPFPESNIPEIPGRAASQLAKDDTKNGITSKKFAAEFAIALKQLHSIPIKPEHKNGYQDTWRLDIENRVQRLKENINKYESSYQECGFTKSLLIDISDKFKQLQFSPYKKCYVHGDLYSKHIIVDDAGKLTGLIDWGDTHIGHPSIDIAAAIMIFNDDSLAEFSKVYGEFDSQVAIFRSLCHSISILPYAQQKQDHNLLNWSKYALTRSIKLFNNLFI